MDILNIIISFIDKIIWPTFLLVIIFIFRSQISNILLSISKLKYKDFEINLKDEISNIKATIKASEKIPPMKKIKKEQIGKEESKVETTSILKDARELIELEHTIGITMGWTALEVEIRKLVLRKNRDSDYKSVNSTLQNLWFLKEENIIDLETYFILEKMRDLRNKAVGHAKFHVEISSNDSFEYIDLAENLIDKLKKIY